MEAKATLPSEEDFKDTQLLVGDPPKQQILIEEKYQREAILHEQSGGPNANNLQQAIVQEPDDASPSSKNTFINLWKEELVKEDESNQVSVNAHN